VGVESSGAMNTPTGSINHPPSIHLDVAQTASSADHPPPVNEINDPKKDSGKKVKKKKANKNNDAKQVKGKKG